MSKPFKVALITGAGRRIGAEIAHTLHAAGINVVLHYNHSAAEAKRLCTILNEQRPHSAVLTQCDLLKMDQLELLVKEAAHAWGHLDILINNAAKFYKTPIYRATEANWDDLINCNLKAPFFLAQLASHYINPQHGCIINITDIHGERPMQDYPIYCISKAALTMMTKALAKELGPHIRVNAVSPGTVMWPEGDNMLTEKQREIIINKTSLHRHGTAKDVARAVLFLVKDADFVTGQVITVDGGRSLST